MSQFCYQKVRNIKVAQIKYKMIKCINLSIVELCVFFKLPSVRAETFEKTRRCIV